MGDKQVFQPLTREDRITVVLYRAGIVISAIIMSALAYLLVTASSISNTALISPAGDILAYGLYASVGISVFFIHLYVGKFKSFLKNLYYVSLACLIVLLSIGKGSLSGALVQGPISLLLLLPISGCLGFVTAKEAFCFKLVEGYLLAMIMPIYLLLVSGSILTGQGAAYGLVLIAFMLVIFTLRKVFMPIAYDIGDKSAYQ
ncbi:MAG TPA: DUF2301 domain-containing membrane protein [Nitrospirota bacterium]|nr:DUF2301 domain-containing membrane protein [Nitrospirota bacterium]